MLRHLHTTQERRESLRGYCRAKRNLNNLPNSRDDYWIECDRCWKSYRKTQYRTVDKFRREKKSSNKFAEHASRRDHFHKEHRWCYRNPCGYCLKHNVWKEYDRLIDRKYKRRIIDVYLKNNPGKWLVDDYDSDYYNWSRFEDSIFYGWSAKKRHHRI